MLDPIEHAGGPLAELAEIASAVAAGIGVHSTSARSLPSATTSRSACCELPAPNTTRPGRDSMDELEATHAGARAGLRTNS